MGLVAILFTAAAFIYVLCFWDDPAIRRFNEARDGAAQNEATPQEDR